MYIRIQYLKFMLNCQHCNCTFLNNNTPIYVLYGTVHSEVKRGKKCVWVVVRLSTYLKGHNPCFLKKNSHSAGPFAGAAPFEKTMHPAAFEANMHYPVKITLFSEFQLIVRWCCGAVALASIVLKLFQLHYALAQKLKLTFE